MGEYATYNGQDVKIGTCEDMYYLRADQLDKISGAPTDILDWARFRFPFPDEDSSEPGTYGDHNRSVALHGMSAPAGVDHDSVQFVAHAGYNVCLPCPESMPDADDGFGPIDVAGFRVHRNGFSGRVKLCQQRFIDGQLVAIVECGGCGTKWRLPTIHDAEPAIESLAAEAKKRGEDGGRWYLTMAERILAGYTIAERLRATLRVDNMFETAGEWSVYDLAQANNLPIAIVRAVLPTICPNGGRYVGGTSGTLYSLRSES